MHAPIADRKEFYQVQTRNIRICILLVSMILMILSSGILCRRLHLTYSDKISPDVPAQYLNRIFDPFFTSNAVGKGTKSDLSICYGIIQKMGGTIAVKSQVGQGTSFSIQLPVNVRQTDKPPTINSQQPLNHLGRFCR